MRILGLYIRTRMLGRQERKTDTSSHSTCYWEEDQQPITACIATNTNLVKDTHIMFSIKSFLERI